LEQHLELFVVDMQTRTHPAPISRLEHAGLHRPRCYDARVIMSGSLRILLGSSFRTLGFRVEGLGFRVWDSWFGV
jgi:hypothetical protein